MTPRTGVSVCWLVVSVALCGATRVHSQGSLFVRGTDVPVGPGPGQVVLMDVNRDGHLDMVTRHLLQRQVSVLLGDGKSGFIHAPGSPMTLGYQPGSMVVADFNGDTTPDLAVSLSERDAVDVFLGDRKGGFSRISGSPVAVSPSTEFYTRWLGVADVNRDGRLDILTANGTAYSFGMLFGDGQGRFAVGPTVRRESPGGRQALAVGDVDGDGQVDVALAGRTDPSNPEAGRIWMLRGDGTGALRESSPSLAVSPPPMIVTFADVNGDRHPDLLCTHGEAGLLETLLNDGHWTFARAPGSPIRLQTAGFGVAVADVDGDSRADVVIASGHSAVVLLGSGLGGFTPAPGSPFQTGASAYGLAVGDINEDGKPDVIASNFEGSAVTVLLHR